MKKSKIILSVFVLMALLVAASSVSFGAGREKVVIAVAQIADTSPYNLGSSATDYVTSAFIRLKYFRVLERSRIDQVMQEVAHQQTGFVDEKSAVQVGKQLGAQAIVLGTVSAAGVSKNQQQCMTVNAQGKTVAVPCLVVTASATLSVRMVNIETGEVMFSDQLVGMVSNNYNVGSQPPPDTTLISTALQGAAGKIYPHIQKAFPLKGTVVKKEEQWIYIDLGSDWGVNKGRGLIFYSEKGKEIKNPKTGEIVGYEPIQVAEDHVSEVMETMCKAKVGKKEAELIHEGDTVVVKPQIFY